MGDQKVVDSMISDGLWCAFNDYHMGITAENLCDQYNITREEQDEFSARSQERAANAMEEGKFAEEIVLCRNSTDEKESQSYLIRMNIRKKVQLKKN